MSQEKPLKLAIFTDYDGTITAEDSIDLILDTYGAKDWLETSKRLDKAGAKNIERMSAEFAGFGATVAQVCQLVREKIHIDETFKELLAYARRRGWKVVVLSHGVRQSVETVFEKYGISGIEWHSNALVEESGKTTVTFPERYAIDDGECSTLCGVCKAGHLRQAKREGYATVYMGDGITDRCGAAEADLVFAKRYLKKYLTQKGQPFVAFQTFADVSAELAKRFPE
jgi:2,3-diketo-5-methylthio-1-phosphopentane phosphatase